jgi:hypothetical protein
VAAKIEIFRNLKIYFSFNFICNIIRLILLV